MALSFIGATSSVTETTSIPVGHVAGDLMLVFAFRVGVKTAPTLPSGWTSVGVNTGFASASVVAYKIATSATEVSGTWTNASGIVCHVYRGQKTGATPVINSSGAAATSTTVNYSGIVTMAEPGTSWVVRFAGHASNNTALETAPSGHTLRTNTAGASSVEVSGFDTNGSVATSSYASLGVSGTSADWITKTIEILEGTVTVPPDTSASGSFLPFFV